MQRRRFVTLMGVGATGALAVRSSKGLAAQGKWRPDGVGSLARIGVLTPDFDPVPESEMWAMAPRGVSVHASRVSRHAGSFADAPHVDGAAELLAGLAPRVIVYAYTSSSYAPGAEADDALRVRLETRTRGIPVVLTAPAASEALRILDVHRVALVHPPWFTEELNDKGSGYFRARGLEVVSCARLTPARRFAEVAPAELYDWTKANVPRKAEAVFIGGNGLRAIAVIGALEETLGRPVLTANQVAFWQALQLVGMSLKVRQYGRIFTRQVAER
ncbi:MAG: maleate cis-trans isomerase family protein [Gemmatimonadaceae bacterium]